MLSKPGKPVEAMTSLRTIVLLNALRKTLSLVVFARIADKVDAFLSLGQSGLQHGSYTADVVLCYRWLAAKTQSYQSSYWVLGTRYRNEPCV